MIDEEKKWQFCESKVCWYCRRNLEEVYKDSDEIVTGCFFCARSFVE